MSKQDAPRRKRRWLIVVAAVLIVAALATLTVVRFWPKDQSTHTEDTRDIWDFAEPTVSSDGTYATIETDHLSFWTVFWVNVTDDVYAYGLRSSIERVISSGYSRWLYPFFLCYDISMTRVQFESVPIEDNDEPLVDLATYPFILETVYFNRGLSVLRTHWLRHGAAEKLMHVQKSLGDNYRLKIWDGWRPRTVQNALYQEFWQNLHDKNPSWSEAELRYATEQFVTMATDPKRIPPHATGGTVDLTIIDIDGCEVDMGTVFDHFGPEAAPEHFDKHDMAIARNRRQLRDAMINQGFTADDDEWWHFDYGCQLWAVRSGRIRAIYGEAAILDV